MTASQQKPTLANVGFLDTQQKTCFTQQLMPSNFCVLGHFQGIVYFNVQVAHCAFQLRVAKK